MMWCLNVQIHSKVFDSEFDDVVEKCVGRDREGSGFGFGVRDLDFFFDTAKEAHNAGVKVMEIDTEYEIDFSVAQEEDL